MDRKFWLDCIFATLFIFGLMWTFDNVSEFKIFDAFQPIGDALDDMEMSDIAFSQLREDPLVDTNIVLVNIGLEPRSVTARQLEIISQYNPKVIGIDSYFPFPKEDTLGDIMLTNAIAEATKKTNVVLVTKLLQSDSLARVAAGEEVYDSLKRSWPSIRGNAYEGYANLETDAENQDDVKTCRRFPPFRHLLNGNEEVAFSVKMAQLYNPEKAEKIHQRDELWEVINYRGNTVDFYGASSYPGMFYALDVEDVLMENFVPSMIEGKIVIFGYLGSNFFDTSWDDKFFTPLNKKYAGKANPDMYGAVVHANALLMILNEDYVNVLDDKKDLLGIFFAVLICFINVVLFSIIYRRLSRWYDGITKLIQLVEILIITFIMIQVFASYSFKLNLTITLVAVALTGDSLEVFYGVVKNLFHKERRKHLFTIQKDPV